MLSPSYQLFSFKAAGKNFLSPTTKLFNFLESPTSSPLHVGLFNQSLINVLSTINFFKFSIILILFTSILTSCDGLVETEIYSDKEGIMKGDVLVAMHGWKTESLENLAYVLDQTDVKERNDFMFYILRDKEPFWGQMRVAERQSP